MSIYVLSSKGVNQSTRSAMDLPHSALVPGPYHHPTDPAKSLTCDRSELLNIVFTQNRDTEGRALTLVCTALSPTKTSCSQHSYRSQSRHWPTSSPCPPPSEILQPFLRRDAWANLQNVHVVHADTILRCGVVYPELEVGGSL